eukprot:3385392-Rhodomonas_salina.1
MARQPSLFLLAALIATLRHVHGATFVDPTINVALGDPHAGGVRLEMPSHPMFQQTRQENPSSESVTLSEGGSKEDVAVNVMTAKDARKTSAVPTAETVPIYFSLAGIPEVQDVTVCGSWSAWMDHYKLAKQGDDFDGVIDLPVGKHTFKFIVDGACRPAVPCSVVLLFPLTDLCFPLPRSFVLLSLLSSLFSLLSPLSSLLFSPLFPFPYPIPLRAPETGLRAASGQSPTTRTARRTTLLTLLRRSSRRALLSASSTTRSVPLHAALRTRIALVLR